MSEFTPEDVYKMHYKEVEVSDDEPEVYFGELSDSAIQTYGIMSDLLNKRIQEDEPFAVDTVNEYLAGSYDEEGIAQWWVRPRKTLDGKSPQEMWVVNRNKVIALARSLAGPMDQS